MENRDKRIRVLIADDHAVVRGGLRLFILAFPDLELVGEADTGEQAVEFCRLYSPDVVLMDIMMPGISGVEATREIHAKFSHVKVIILTSFSEQQLVQDAVAAGASGYMIKSASPVELVEAIRAVERGESTFSAEAKKFLQKEKTNSANHEALTSREWEVFRSLFAGKSNEMIATELVVSKSTVKYHVSNIFSKLGVGNRSEAMAYAIRHHLFD